MSEAPKKRKYTRQYKAPTLDEIFEKLGPNSIAYFRWNGLTGRVEAAIGIEALQKEGWPDFPSIRDAKDYMIRRIKEIPA